MTRKSLCILTILMGLFVRPAIAQPAKSYDAIYVFGDSYCDVGNIFIATGGTTPAAPYFDGQFSNAPIWIEHVAGYMGLPMEPSLAGGTDFAFGGAWVTEPQVTVGGTIPSVPQQVALYLSLHANKADPNALYVIEGGGNDILGAAGVSPNQLGFEIASGIAESELLLLKAGARHFLIPNLFDVGLLPAGQANATFASAASKATNQWLNVLVGLGSLLEGVHILRLDVFSLLNAVQIDPSHFGFTNITTPCLNPVTSTSCSDPDHTLFWDIEHPTGFGHAFFAVTAETVLAQQ
jgi:phospholipase/lecithinase/hemolysin